MLRGHILLQSDPQWASADPLGACAQCFHSLWVTSVSFLIPCYSRARQSSLSATPGWPVCLSPLLRVISLSDSPHYVITLIFPLAFRNTSHTAPHPQSRISPSECMNPFISPCSATLAEVQPCSAGGQLFQRQPLGLSKTINNRPGQTEETCIDFLTAAQCIVCLGQQLWDIQVSSSSCLLPWFIQSVLFLLTFCCSLSRQLSEGLSSSHLSAISSSSLSIRQPSSGTPSLPQNSSQTFKLAKLFSWIFFSLSGPPLRPLE